MKKLLLGTVMMSAMAFAANPGDRVPTIDGETAKAGVPLEVKVNVLPADSRLILVDENDILINKLSFDHGNVLAGTETQPLQKIVILKRRDNKPFSETAGDQTYIAKFTAKNGTSEIAQGVGNFILQGNTNSITVPSTLAFDAEEITVASTDTFVRTPVTSTVNIPVDARTGLYIGSGTFEASLTYKAN